MSPLHIEYGKIIRVGEEEAFVANDSNMTWVVEAGEEVSRTYKKRGQKLELDVLHSDDDKGGVVLYCYERLVWSRFPMDHKTGIVLVEGQESVIKKFEHPFNGEAVGFRARHVSAENGKIA